MICELEGVNNRDDVEDLVVFSTDIEAMYPSLDTDQVAADLAREFLDCELEVNYDGEGRAGLPGPGQGYPHQAPKTWPEDPGEETWHHD